MNKQLLRTTFISIVLMLLSAQPAVPKSKPMFEFKWDSNRSLDTSIVIQVHRTLPKYELRLVSDDSGALLIVLSMNRRIKDTINVISIYDEYDDQWPPRSLEPQTILFGEDFNFDGYLDLAVISTEDGRDNPSYSIWLFDRKDLCFKENDDFTEHIHWDYTLNKNTKTITTSHINYFFTEDCETITYRVLQNRLIPTLIESIEHFQPDDTSSSYSYRWKMERIINNQTKLIKEMVFKSADEMGKYFKKFK